MIYWFFGYPGIGKDYCASHLARIGHFPHIDADDFLTDEDREKLLNKSFSVEDRLLKLGRIIQHLKQMQKHHENIAVADSLPDNVSRGLIINSFSGKVKLILVTTDDRTHIKRISNRKKHFFTIDLLEDYKKKWEKVNVVHAEFVNNDSNDFDERLRKLF
ncbi:MAG: hypothetical protein Q7T54_01465 [Candidatus Levybacteria bacterium]|nr:hypothetical protein [Candidatus Levybacteria bacterium]